MASTTTMSDLEDMISDQETAMNIGWVIFCGSMVFITQLGFFQLEAAHVSDVWIHSIILKNFEDSFAGILVFSLIGYGFASSGLINYNFDYFLLHNIDPSQYVQVFYQSLYAIASTTIVSSCVLERIKNRPYLFVIVFMTMIEFPLFSYWCWNSDGWLSNLGYIDFSGGSVVHIPGGILGLILIIYLGQRHYISDYKETHHKTRSNSNISQSAMGIFLLWFGWFGFNCGSAMSITENPLLIGRIAINTSLSSASGGATAAILTANQELETVVNGVLIGLVSATGGSHVLPPWAAVVSGILSGFVIVYWKKMITRFGLDDPLSATAVHIGGGIVSVLSTALFRIDEGLIYGNFRFFCIQMLGCFCIICCSLFSAMLLCFILESTVGLKVDIFSGHLMDEENRNNASETLNIAVTVRTPTTNAWLWHFHKFLEKRLSFEHLDFLVACNRLINKIEYFEEKYGVGVFMEKEKEAILLKDRDIFIGLYLCAKSDYVVNVSSTKLKFFKAEKLRLKPFELKTVLLEVYVEILRMLQIPCTEWLRDYYEKCQIKGKSGWNLARISVESENRRDGDMDSSGSNMSKENNIKYRKVYHVRSDWRIEWKIVRYTASHNCPRCLQWMLCKKERPGGDGTHRTSRSSIVLQHGRSSIIKQFRDRNSRNGRVERPSFIIQSHHELL